LVSGFRTVLGEATDDAQRRACEPLVALADRWYRGRQGFSNSRWHNGFCISEGALDEQGLWKFQAITPTETPEQPRLF
jgi:hypothetical protein